MPLETGKGSGRCIPIDCETEAEESRRGWLKCRGEGGGPGRGARSEGGSSCQRQRRSGMAPILVLILVVCNRGGGNVVLSPTGSHRHRTATVTPHVRITMHAYSGTVLYAGLPGNVDCQSRPPNAKSSQKLSHCITCSLFDPARCLEALLKRRSFFGR